MAINNSIPYFHPLRAGEYMMFCDVCRAKFYSSEIVTRWDGKKVCRDDNDPIPNNRYIPQINENLSVPDPRPSSDQPMSTQPGNIDVLSEGWYNPVTPSE